MRLLSTLLKGSNPGLIVGRGVLVVIGGCVVVVVDGDCGAQSVGLYMVSLEPSL